jgi:cyclin B
VGKQNSNLNLVDGAKFQNVQHGQQWNGGTKINNFGGNNNFHNLPNASKGLEINQIYHDQEFVDQLSSNPKSIYELHYNKIPHEYLVDIWDTFRTDERTIDVSFDRIITQTDINEKMRAILIDWIVDVHHRFNLKAQTLFLTVNIIDRYLSLVQVPRSKLQLIGVCSLFISCKYEEILAPELKDFVYITDKTYNKQEIIQTESDILDKLGFNFTLPTSLNFFELISLNFNFTEMEYMYGRYLLEFFFLDLKMTRYLPSMVALAACYIVMKANNRSNYAELYSLVNGEVSSSSTKLLKECAKEMYFLVQNAEKIQFEAVPKKFSLPAYLHVSVRK